MPLKCSIAEGLADQEGACQGMSLRNPLSLCRNQLPGIC